MLSQGMRDDLIGVGIALVGIVLFVCVIAPGSAVVSSLIEAGLRRLFGLGAFIIPFAFVLWGISFFVKTEESRIGRFIIGIALILIAIMSMLSLYNAGTNPLKAATLFDEQPLVDGGGYIGSGLGFLLMSTMGRLIATIIDVGIIIAGLILVGLSISTIFLFLRNLLGGVGADDDDADLDEEPDFKPQVRRGRQKSFDDEDVRDALPEGDTTIMLGGKGRRRRSKADDAASAETVVLGTGYTDAAAETIVLSERGTGGAQTSRKSRRTSKDQPVEPSATTVELPAQTAAESGDAGGFVLPVPQVLRVSGKRSKATANLELEDTAAQLQRTLEEFSVPARIVGWLAGPTVTMFKVELPSGVRLSKLTSLADDIALALAASSVRIAQIPNTSLVGVEIPNKTRVPVLLGDIMPAVAGGPLTLGIGEDVDGNKIAVDLAKMPHLLIGGTTGSGKSVCINSMIMSVLMRATPSEVRMILIDPKRVEFSCYNGIPHLYVPVVTEPKEAAAALRWGVVEMERRLKVFEQAGARNIGAYNKMIAEGKLADGDDPGPDKMPYIMIVIDELSDLMMAAGKDVEDSIVRISQLARAAGIHLIVATQRPSSNVVTGMIKANITNRIALSVATGVDSRVILDTTGAEKLVGNGDMLFSKPDWGKPKRIQGCYVGDDEINEVADHLREQGEPEYHLEILQQKLEGGSAGGGRSATLDGMSDDDPLIWEAAEAVVHAGLGSTSMLQRRLKVGYARAGRIMDMLEEKGVVGPQDGSKARDVLIDTLEDLEALKAFEAYDQEGM